MPSPHELRQLLRRARLSRGHRVRGRQRAEEAPRVRRGVPGRDLSVPSARGSHAIPDDAADHAVLDHRHALLRRALEVERPREVRRVERVVGDRDLRVEGLLADPPAEVAPLLEKALRAHRVVREPAHEIADGERLEHRPVRARLELAAAAGARRGRRRLARRLGRVDVGGPPARSLRPARRFLVGGQAETDRVRRRLLRGHARRGRDRDLGHAARVDRRRARCPLRPRSQPPASRAWSAAPSAAVSSS